MYIENFYSWYVPWIIDLFTLQPIDFNTRYNLVPVFCLSSVNDRNNISLLRQKLLKNDRFLINS